MLSLIGIFTVAQVFSQAPPCVNEAYMALRNKSISKAKRIIDDCSVVSSNNADVLLMKGNVYLQRYSQEEESLKKDRAYVVKDPDAIFIANESFYQAIQSNSKVEPKTGNFSAVEGQIYCAAPLYSKGMDYLEKNDFDNAEKYLNAAARSFKADSKNPNLATYLSYIYFSLAEIAIQKKDPIMQKKMLIETTNLKAKTSTPYLILYEIYLNEKDTVNAGKILNAAKQNVPDSLSADITEYEMAYYTMMKQTEKLPEIAEKFIKGHGETPKNLALVANYLNNAYMLELAEKYIKIGLEKAPNDFDLNQQMGYRYFFEAENYQNMIDSVTKKRDFNAVGALREKENEALKNAHTWVEKAYVVKKDDVLNNRMLRQLKVKLMLEVPEELKQSLEGK